MIVGILMCCCDNLKVIRNRKNRSFYLLSTYEKKMDKNNNNINLPEKDTWRLEKCEMC